MSADEEVGLRFTADHQAALTALESVTAALKRFGETGSFAARKTGDSANWAEKGIRDLGGAVLGSLGAFTLMEKAVGAVAQRLEDIKRHGEEALAATQNLAGQQRAWQDYLKPGESREGLDKRLEQIGAASGLGGEGARSAFAQIMASRPESGSADDLAEDLAEASRSTSDAGRAAQRAQAIRGLRRNFGEFSREGAAAELARRGWQTDKLETIEGLQRRTGGKESFGFLSAFTAGLGPKADAMGAERLAGLIIDKGKMFTQSESLQKNLEFLRNDQQGKMLVDQMFGLMESGGEDIVGAAGKLGIRNPEMIEPLKQLLRGKGAASDRYRAELGAGNRVNDASAIAAMRATQQARDATVGEKSLSATAQAKANAERLMANSPEALAAQADQMTDEAYKTLGDSSIGLWMTGLGTTRHASAARRDVQRMRGMSPAARIQEDEFDLADRARSETDQGKRDYLQQQIQLLDGIRRAILDQKNNQITITDGGDNHRAVVSPAKGAGQR